MVSRRSFLGGMAAFGVLQGCRSLAVPSGTVSMGAPNLKLGVLSDIHVHEWGMENYLPTISYDVQTFVHALESFRDEEVDGVVIAGDLADYGMISEMEAVARAWELVFPDSRLPSGRKVEKLFVMGNHDWEGFVYRDYGKRLHPDPDDLRRAALQFNLKAAWERIWKEPFSPVWTKTVRGYAFVGAHWMDFRGGDFEKVSFAGAPEAIRAAGRAADPNRPFFYIQHPQPRGTNYGEKCWGHDRGDVTAALSEFPNAFAISGHSHYPLTDDRAIWQGAFTSLQMSSLRYSAVFCEDMDERTLEDAKSFGPDAAALDAKKLLPRYATTDGRHGSLLRVYDDRIEITRRDFLSFESLGDDWILPFPPQGGKPYAYGRQAARETAPDFDSAAQLFFLSERRPDRSGVGHDALVVRFPSRTAAGASRAQRFEVEIHADDRLLVRKFVTPQGFNRAVARQPQMTECPFDRKALSKGPLLVRVTPVAAFGTRGRPLEGRVRCELGGT